MYVLHLWQRNGLCTCTDGTYEDAEPNGVIHAPNGNNVFLGCECNTIEVGRIKHGPPSYVLSV